MPCRSRSPELKHATALTKLNLHTLSRLAMDASPALGGSGLCGSPGFELSHTCCAFCVSICTFVQVKQVKRVELLVREARLLRVVAHVLRLLRQNLYVCTSKASKLSTCADARPNTTMSSSEFAPSLLPSAYVSIRQHMSIRPLLRPLSRLREASSRPACSTQV
jgi:hypothetical protein